MWRTPQAGDATRGSKSQRGKSSIYRDQAGRHSLVTEVAMWRTPMVADAGEKVSPATHQLMLANQARLFLPPSSPAPTIDAGETCSTIGHNSPPPSPKRRLNPFFAEALMRWPTGLSRFERSETAWTRWWAQQLGYVSALSLMPIEQNAQGQLL